MEHELYHCAQALDQYDSPKFDRFGAPVFAMRGHDLEQFLGVVERYGPTTQAEREFLRAAKSAPLIGDGVIDLACGTCLAKAA